MSDRVIGWIDAGSGASGDMLLGALLGAGVPLDVIQHAVDAVTPEPVGLSVEQVTRQGFAATRCLVDTGDSTTHRTWSHIRALLDGSSLETVVRDRAVSTFTRLAEAEARVHGSSVDEVHFHEVGALDAIADVVGVCAGLVHVGLETLVVSPVALGGGHVDTAHGRLPVPAPAVAELLRGAPSYGDPRDLELCTPTGAALLVAHATGWGVQPMMTTAVIGVGAGGHDPQGQANVLRLFVGSAVDTTATLSLLLETNVDDLDPRLWPAAIAALLAAGASDAWLTPILMKKGRPAHTLSVLVTSARADAVRREVFRHTSAIGLREQQVAKHALDRSTVTVEVDGHAIEVKLAALDGEVLNLQPEYEHVAAAAVALGRPAKDVLQEAVAQARSRHPQPT
ncbi:MAG: nickel pincer cofactor biosynthesis protein LarC [Marmoricola sp.]